jgi:hypothetical protein
MEINSCAPVTLAMAVFFGAGCGDKGVPSTAPQAADASALAPDAPPLPTSGFIDPTLANTGVTPAPANQGLQYSGAVAVYRSIAPTAAAPTEPAQGQWLEISAPILPKVLVLYQGEGSNYPTTPQAEAKLAHDSALTFETLLGVCQPLYPGMLLWRAGDPLLSDAQVATNYQLLADCAYEQYTAKPYWIPQLVQDVDICGQELGSGWRMITEPDILSITDADYLRLQRTLDGAQSVGSTAGFGSFYFSFAVWVLRSDGSVSGAILDPNVSPRFLPLVSSSGSPFDPRGHYEGALALRCVRVTDSSQ